MGHPGTLPRFNGQVLEYGILLGLAMNCKIREYNEFARKNYFYADLPKGYQITQHLTPLAYDGYLDLECEEGKHRRVGITRIHMEEDAGKSIHDQDPLDTLVDLNRCGVPLLEIVSEPDLRTAREAYLYLQECATFRRPSNTNTSVNAKPLKEGNASFPRPAPLIPRPKTPLRFVPKKPPTIIGTSLNRICHPSW
jgi:Asp-tRNA(Asn)/Glu-tRNA(Gln) amidotransferase B subunit